MASAIVACSKQAAMQQHASSRPWEHGTNSSSGGVIITATSSASDSSSSSGSATISNSRCRPEGPPTADEDEEDETDEFFLDCAASPQALLLRLTKLEQAASTFTAAMATITSSTGSTESETERAARSVALEQAYVHEVYDQCADRTVQGKHWPRICEFVEELEPGALVCDVGCGNGKYLDVNRNVFKIGIDRCTKLTNIARDRDKEVLTCDNLALPFRDESFDAVLSIAVVHHFSTTERRVRALKELARVLRIGGRIIISVWAMEQKHRKFESQDVLVPWPRAYCISSTGAPIKPRDIFCGDERGHRGDKMHPHPLHPTYLLTKRGSQQRRGSKGNKSYWIDPIFSPSPSTSSLSSPNETCYSFFRRALQKLAGGSRTSRAWFLENWPNGSKDHRPRYDNDEEEENDDEDVDSLPIELRRLEEGVVINVIGCGDENSNSQDLKRPQLRQQSSDSLSVKSKSLGNMVEAQQRQDIVRSRSSTPRLCSNENSVEKKETTANLVKEQLQSTAAVPRVELAVTTDATTSISTTSTTQTSSKPRLVKQKTHFNDDSCLLDVPKNTAIQPLETDLPEQQESPLSSINSSFKRITSNVHKQSSMNEELMSIERLKERESVRKNIMKQASLNEELIYKSKPTFESFRDTLYSSGARFQLLKSGLTSRIKQSTTNIEKVSGMSLKNGFVRILQSWTSTESPSTNTTSTTTSSNNSEHSRSQCSTPFSMRSGDIERRLSREDGSDSSKDSSLQSDTSVDSEDSFASVIYVPKKNSSPMIETAGLPQAKNSSSNIFGPLSPVGCLQQLSTASAPPSPRVKYAPDFQSSHHRLKHISMSPLVKQFPATSKSLPPPSPPGLSPRTLNSANLKPFFSGNDTIPVANSSSNTAPTTSTGTTSGDVVSDNASFLEKIAEVKRSFDIQPLPKIPSREERSFNTSTLEQTNPFFSMITNDQQAQTSTESVKAISPPKQDLDFTKDLGELQSKATTSTADTSLEKTVDTKEKVSSGNPFLSMTETIAPPALDSLQPVAKTSTSVGASKGAIKKGTKASSGASSSGLPEEEEKIRSSKLNEIKELLSAKPDFAVRTRPAYPLVRRASTSATSSKVSKVLPKMMSLELFNPETDDLDSDSSDAASGTSTPESVGSVISVISDERYKKTDPFDLTNSSSNSSSSNNNSNDSGDSEDKPTTTTATTTATTTTATEPSSTKPAALDKHLSPVESTWSEECKRHLLDLTDRLSSTESLINGTDQYSRKTKLELHSSSTESVSSTRKTSICKYNSGLNKRPAAADSIYVPDNNNKLLENGVICESVDENDVDEGTGSTTKLIQRSCSDDSDNGSVSSSFVVISNSGDVPQKHQQQQLQQQSTKAPKIGQQRYINNSIESSDIGDSIENTISTESSQTSDSRKLYCSGSTASLSSSESSRARLQARSSSEETPSRRLGRHRLHQHQSTRSNGTLSGSSSQESLPSDQINYHQFYHVFREGELDQLIEKYVENLHIISSYYDHASWCVVAEKVQVWTI